MMPPLRRREEDQHWYVRLNKISGILTAAGVLLGTVLGLYIAIGGQYTLPNDRVAKIELRIQNNTERIERVEARLDTNGAFIIDSMTKMNRRLENKIDLLTVSKCREAGVWPPRLEAVCDTLRNIIPLR